MDLLSELPEHVWHVTDTARLTYREATSLDEDIARELAKQWFGEIVTGDDTRRDLALDLPTAQQLVADLADPSPSDHPVLMTLFAVGLAKQCITRAEGFTVDGEPAGLGRRLFARLLRDRAVKAEWMDRVYANLSAARAAGNA